MKAKIFSIMFASFMTASLFSVSLFTEMDMFSNEEREEIITKKILKCKDVVDVKVKEHGDEVSKATIAITLTNDRVLVLESYGIRLKLEKLYILKLGDVVPVMLGYRTPTSHASGVKSITFGIFRLKGANIKYLDKKLKSVKHISDLIENYDLIYNLYSDFPEANENFPKISYDDATCEDEIYCELWEEIDNPHFYKTETEGGKFYKMTEESFSKYREKDFITGKTKLK